MSVFAHKNDKGKFNLGNESDLAGIADGTAFNSIKALAGMIAGVENGATASKTYNKGEYILRNGEFYEVTTTIAAGAAITVDVNILKTTIGEELTSINANLLEKVFKPSARPINAETDLLAVTLGDNYATKNQPYFFSSDKGTLVNTPPGSGTQGTGATFYGWREVQCQMSLTTVILHEMYPNYGDVWSNTYDTNQSNWLGWRKGAGFSNASSTYSWAGTNITISRAGTYFILNISSAAGSVAVNGASIGTTQYQNGCLYYGHNGGAWIKNLQAGDVITSNSPGSVVELLIN